MRLFGVPGGTLSQARASYGFMLPFDLAPSSVPLINVEVIDQGGFIFDLGGIFALQFNNVMMGYPDYVFITPTPQFNQVIESVLINGNTREVSPSITGTVDTPEGPCKC